LFDKPLTVMGLMSGTSVDGVDACLAKFWKENEQVQYVILATHSREIPAALRQRLLQCMADKHVLLEEFCALNVAVGELFAETALGLLQEHNIPASSVDAIGSHGQTLYHWPPTEPGKRGGTLQIGEPSIIAEITGIPVIADFRPRDMAAGGHGAPLVCFADLALLQDPQIGRAIQNIGGIANVTVVPSRSAQQAHNTPVIAFDTGPGNMLMDAAMAAFYGQNYDKKGEVAASGTIHKSLLAQLMSHPYLTQAPPKTTGRESFGEPFFRKLLAEFPDISPADWVSTLNQFTACSIVDAYERFVFPHCPVSEMVVGGGGVYNQTLLKRVQALFQANNRQIAIKTHADFGIPDQYKEALAFALLAWKALLGEPNSLPSCTGAHHPVIMGKRVI
jgi:anhydro-N-acetylmuramic acid kinase